MKYKLYEYTHARTYTALWRVSVFSDVFFTVFFFLAKTYTLRVFV